MGALNYRRILKVLTLLATVAIGELRVVDMTHYLDKDARHAPIFRDFEKDVAINRSFTSKITVLSHDLALNEHTGTHIDAPIHIYPRGKMLHEIPLSDLMGPAVVLDIREKAKSNRDYALTIDDIKEHEAEYGLIEEGSVVFVNTGGAELYGDLKKFAGTETPKDPITMHFPGFGGPASDFLIRKRKIKGIGTDRMSFDVASDRQFHVHYSVCSQGRWGLENVNRLNEIPARGAAVIVAPILIEGGSGGPARVIAYLDREELPLPSRAIVLQTNITAIAIAIMVMVHMI